jgi:iron complex outermembrane receptor protein
MKTIQKNLIAMAIASVVTPFAAHADIEEIIVTANKRAQSIQDVPIAISAFDNAALAEIGADSLENLTNFVPGVALFDDRGAGQPTWVIRGVGLADFNANNTPTAAIYYDEAYMTSNALGGIGLYDVERVEVLKGPQGGLYGRNTTGGAVRIVSNRPNVAESGGYASVGYEARYGGTVVEGAYNAAVSEELALRVAMQRTDGGGWQDSLATPEDDDHGDRDSLAIRGQLLYSPSDDLEILFKADIGRDNSETMLGRANGFYSDAIDEDPTSDGYGYPLFFPCAAIMSGQRDETTCFGMHNLLGDPRLPSDQTKNGSVVLSNPINQLDNDWTGYTLTVDKDLGYASLVSISSFLNFDYYQDFDYDGTPFVLVQSRDGYPDHDTTIEQWSQEFRLLSNNEGPLTWLAGATYAKDTNDTMTSADVTMLSMLDPENVPFDLVTNTYSQETTTWAVYGQAGYDISDSLNINGSLRYTDEDKEIDYVTNMGVGSNITAIGSVEGLTSSLDSNWSGHLGIDWRVTDNTLVYAKYSRGFKSGGFFAAWTDDVDTLIPYKEEVNDAFEVGVKSNPSDELQVNASVYFYDYQDTQGKRSLPADVAVNQSGTLSGLGTLGDAEHTGAELDLLWSPAQMPGFSVQLAGAWLDAEITSSDYVSYDQLGVETSLEGLDRDFAPKTSYSVNIRQEANVTESLLGSASLTYSWRDDLAPRSSQLSDIDYGLLGQTDYGVLNLYLAIANVNEGWELSIVGENITDEVYIVRATGDDGGSYMDMLGRPATWSVNARFDF